MTLRLDYQALTAGGMKALGAVYAYVGGCGLPKDLVDLVYLRVSQINGCSYCVDSHSHDLLRAGTPPRKLMLLSVWREAGSQFSDRERSALAWAEAVTQLADGHVSDETFTVVRAQFSEKEVSDLTVAIGLINSYNRFAMSFRRSPPPE